LRTISKKDNPIGYASKGRAMMAESLNLSFIGPCRGVLVRSVVPFKNIKMGDSQYKCTMVKKLVRSLL